MDELSFGHVHVDAQEIKDEKTFQMTLRNQ